MLCVRAPKLEKQLNELTQTTGKTKSYYVRMALEWYLNDHKSTMQATFPCFIEEENAISI